MQVRMTVTKISTNNKCWRKCGEKRTLLGGNVTVRKNVHWYGQSGEQYGASFKKKVNKINGKLIKFDY